MFTHPILEKLGALKLGGMMSAFEEQLQHPEASNPLSFEERFGLCVDRENLMRGNRRFKSRLKNAKLKMPAAMEDIDYRHPRSLDKGMMLSLLNCQWVRQGRNILIVGPTGTGKTYLSCAFSHRACLEGFTAHYARAFRLLPKLGVAKADGRFERMVQELGRYDVLVLDDFAMSTFTDEERLHLLEILDERYKVRSTIIATQLPIKLWHKQIGDETLADAIVDRLIHNAYTITLSGPSLREELKAKSDVVETAASV